jgi:hypothetical protein
VRHRHHFAGDHAASLLRSFVSMDPAIARASINTSGSLTWISVGNGSCQKRDGSCGIQLTSFPVGAPGLSSGAHAMTRPVPPADPRQFAALDSV